MTQRIDPLRDPEPLIRRVYAYVAYRIGDGADAEDVTSTIFERALRYRDSYRGRRGEPIAWLLGIADRCIVDLLAERKAPSERSELLADPADAHANSLVRVDIQRAVAELSPRDRELVALRYGADLTAREIARLIGASTNATEVALHRALRRLRDRLDPPEPTSRPAILPTLDLESRST
jgi:RNA polymerase sigma-70 factor (ECF subfamily)